MADPSTLAAALNYYGNSRLKRREFDGGEPPTIEGLGEQWQGVRETVNSALGGDQGPRPMMTDAQVWDRIKATGGGINDYTKYMLEQPPDPRVAEALFGATSNIGKAIVPGIKQAIGSPGIRAYHGSPHDFDAFDASKIGTGEGAQAYGPGMYFAENENVARSYKAAGQPTYLGADRIQAAQDVLKEAGGDINKARTLADERMKATTKYSEAKLWQDVVNNLPDLSGKTPGRMYEVNIKADPDRFLDWDKQLSEQPKAVQDSVNSLVRLTQGERERLPIRSVMELVGDNPVAAAALKQAGIPGIKYLDQGSRASGVGSSNYVVFDPATIEILRKYGLLGMIGGGAAAAGAQPDAGQTYD